MTAPAAPVAHGRRVFRNTLFTGVVGVLSLLANFVVIGEAVRHLGMGPYGVLTLALAFSLSAGYPQHLRPRPAVGRDALRRRCGRARPARANQRGGEFGVRAALSGGGGRRRDPAHAVLRRNTHLHQRAWLGAAERSPPPVRPVRGRSLFRLARRWRSSASCRDCSGTGGSRWSTCRVRSSTRCSH